MKIFVFGLYEEDSGKTLLALQLIRALKEVGTSIVPFKPMSGHNLWRQYENLEKNVKMKKLFSYDLDRLRNASGTSYPHEILNPVCILTSPYNVKLYIENDASPKSYLKESLYRNFMLGRITQCSNESVSNLYLVNEQRIPFLLHHEDIINSLLENADETKAISSEDEFLKYYQSELVENAIHSCYQYLASKNENIIIEGFNNAILPWHGVLSSDVFLGAAPGYTLFFEKSQFINAVNTLMLYKNIYSLTSESLLQLLHPVKIYKIPLRPLNFKWFESEINKLVDDIISMGL